MSRARDNANLSPTIADARMPNLTGDVTTVEGAVATTIANDAVTGAKIENNPTIAGNLTVSGDLVPSTPLSHRNMIINGGMNVAQRGTSSTSGGYQTVDRFQSGGGTIATTQSQESLSSSDTGPWEAGFRKAYKALTTNATTSTAAYYSLLTILEAQDLANSGWNYTSTSSYITLSFWALSNDAGAYTCSVRSQDGTSYYYDTTYTLVAGTWKKVEITIPGKSDLQFDNNTSQGIQIHPFIAYGTDYTASGSAGSWQTYNGAGGDETIPNTDATAWMNNSGSYIMITGVQLELGSNATPFEHRSYGDELLRCQRYYYIIVDQQGGAASMIANTGVYHTNLTYFYVGLPVQMRATGTLEQVSGTSYYLFYANSTGYETTGFTLGNPSLNAVRLVNNDGTMPTIGMAGWWQTSNDACFIAITAEL